MTQGTQAGRRLAALRRTYKKVCPVCSAQFEGIARRVYDKPACQVKAYRQRRKEREHVQDQEPIHDDN